MNLSVMFYFTPNLLSAVQRNSGVFAHFVSFIKGAVKTVNHNLSVGQTTTPRSLEKEAIYHREDNRIYSPFHSE